MPNYIETIICSKYNAEKAELIIANWSLYSNLKSFSNACETEILREARLVYFAADYVRLKAANRAACANTATSAKLLSALRCA